MKESIGTLRTII